MNKKTYRTKGVCAGEISFEYENNKLYNVQFHGGCQGNLSAIAKMLEGQDFDKICELFEGNDCRSRGTSCTDQLVKAIKEVI